MRFTLEPELELFAESVRGALGAWEAPLEPDFGTWQDDRDDALAARLADVGWAELWADPELLGPAVAGGIELGRAVAPLSLVDEATLGEPLALDGRVRHGEGRVEGGEREPTLDGTGTLRGVETSGRFEPARLQAWGVVTLAYLAGLADGALDKAVAHARSREQFGAPLAALPAIQARLADAALARDGLLLSAWSAAAGDGFPRDRSHGRARLPGGDGARATGSRRNRLCARGRHPSLLPSCEDGAGLDGRLAPTRPLARRRQAAGERSSHIRPKGHLAADRGRL